MNAVATEKNADAIKTTRVVTTLFDLIAGMQDKAADTNDEALIVPTVAEWVRSGRIKFHREVPAQTAA